MSAQTEERGVARYGEQKKPASVEQIEKAGEEMTRGGTYEVWGPQGKKQIANAAGVNATFINRAGTSGEQVGTKVVDVGKNATQAWAKVAAYRGSPDAPLAWVEDAVVIDFDLLRQKILWDSIDKGVSLWESDPETGNNYKKKYKVDFRLQGDVPIPTDQRIQMHIIRLFLQKKLFAERDAVTHATERAQRKILAGEWREDGELLSEREEVDTVNDMRESESCSGQDDQIPFGPLRGSTWRAAARTPEGRSELGRIAQTAKVQKYGDAARAALAEWKEKNEPAPPANGSAPRNKGGRPRKQQQEAPPPPQEQPSDGPPPPSDDSEPSDSPPPPDMPGPTEAAMKAGASPAVIAASAVAEANAIINPPKPPPTPPAPPADPARVAAERDLYYKDVRLTVSRWPFVVADEQLASYAASISTMRGGKVELPTADPADLKRLQSYVNAVQRVWEVAKKSIAGEDKALAYLDSKAAMSGYKKFFDPALKKSVLDQIEKVLLASPVGAPIA